MRCPLCGELRKGLLCEPCKERGLPFEPEKSFKLSPTAFMFEVLYVDEEKGWQLFIDGKMVNYGGVTREQKLDDMDYLTLLRWQKKVGFYDK